MVKRLLALLVTLFWIGSLLLLQILIPAYQATISLEYYTTKLEVHGFYQDVY